LITGWVQVHRLFGARCHPWCCRVNRTWYYQ